MEKKRKATRTFTLKYCNKIVQCKRSQANVIAVILIILIVIVAILIVWNIFNPLIKEKGKEAGLEKLTTNLEIKEVVLIGQGASKITVFRGTGKGDITALKFVFYDENGNTDTKEEKTTLPELGTEIYSFSPFASLGKLEKVAVIPVIGGNLGMEFKSEASNIVELPKGLISWWRFDDGKDFVGNNQCSLKPDSIIDDEERGKVADFNGGSAGCGNDSSLSINNEIAISFWIKTSSENGELIRKGNNYNVFLENGFINFSYGEAEAGSENKINDGNWHHAVVTMTGIYIDGQFDSSKFIAPAGKANSEELRIGNFNGLLDEVMIFDEGLANNEIAGLYNNQKK